MTQRLQTLFPLWVLLGAVWGALLPEIASSGKGWIAPMLAAVMLGMGLTVTTNDLRGLRGAGKPLLIGLALQYGVMPLSAWGIAWALQLPPELALGLILVGAVPGGTASNVIAFLAKGDVPLSIAMTTASTLASPLLTPFWIWWLASSWLPVDPAGLLISVGQIVLLPVALGIGLRALWSPSPTVIQGALPLLSMGVIAWIVGVVVALNLHQLNAAIAPVLLAVALLNGAGLALGYLGAKRTGLDLKQRRTVAIEVGMQNSGRAVALAAAHFGGLAALPGAIFSIWHNLTGPLLAARWRRD